MKTIFSSLLLFASLVLNAQTTDTLTRSRITTQKYSGNIVQRTYKTAPVTDVKMIVFGDYSISDYVILSPKSPSEEELNSLKGTTVKVQNTSIAGSGIDPLTFEIYQVEVQKKDDFMYRVFGNDLKEKATNLPESFTVHKTDNENCYGIVDLGGGRIVIPYKGVLLYLIRI